MRPLAAHDGRAALGVNATGVFVLAFYDVHLKSLLIKI
jgi:hypothetical protein